MNLEFSTARTFKCFTQEQVKEINKKIKKNIHGKEDTFHVANVPKKGEFFNIPLESNAFLLISINTIIFIPTSCCTPEKG